MAIERWRPGWGMTPWRPFRELEDMERRLDNMLGRSSLLAGWRHMPSSEVGWSPVIDVFEKDDKFIVKAEIPGMKEEDVDVSVVGDTLTIKSEKKSESEVKEEDYYYCESSYGSFSRSIGLPSNIDTKKIEANYEDGVLEIGLPKVPEIKPKKVSVTAKKKAKSTK